MSSLDYQDLRKENKQKFENDLKYMIKISKHKIFDYFILSNPDKLSMALIFGTVFVAGHRNSKFGDL